MTLSCCSNYVGPSDTYPVRVLVVLDGEVRGAASSPGPPPFGTQPRGGTAQRQEVE